MRIAECGNSARKKIPLYLVFIHFGGSTAREAFPFTHPLINLSTRLDSPQMQLSHRDHKSDAVKSKRNLFCQEIDFTSLMHYQSCASNSLGVKFLKTTTRFRKSTLTAVSNTSYMTIMLL